MATYRMEYRRQISKAMEEQINNGNEELVTMAIDILFNMEKGDKIDVGTTRLDQVHLALKPYYDCLKWTYDYVSGLQGDALVNKVVKYLSVTDDHHSHSCVTLVKVGVPSNVVAKAFIIKNEQAA
jgi:hypothetical protein